MNKLIDKVERIFHKYDIDVSKCVQRVVCTTIKNAVENVAKGSGSSTDKIFDGLSRYVRPPNVPLYNSLKVCRCVVNTIIWYFMSTHSNQDTKVKYDCNLSSKTDEQNECFHDVKRCHVNKFFFYLLRSQQRKINSVY